MVCALPVRRVTILTLPIDCRQVLQVERLQAVDFERRHMRMLALAVVLMVALWHQCVAASAERVHAVCANADARW